MRRDKKKKEAQAAAPLMGAANTGYQQPGFPTQAQTGYYGGANTYQDSEQKPTYYAHNQAQSYPAGPYDPHMSPQQQYGSGLPPQELNAVQYAPQELPTQDPPKPHDAPK